MTCQKSGEKALRVRGKHTSKEGGGQEEVEWNSIQRLECRVPAQQDTILSDQEDQRSSHTGQQRCDNPGEEHLDNSRIDITTPPDNIVGSYKCDAHSQDTSEDGVSGRHRKTNSRADTEVYS